MEIVETGRRRRWSDEAKLRIVGESYSGPRLVSATARRHGISNQLLHDWRRAWREGRLGGGAVGGFVPAVLVPEVAGAITKPLAREAGRLEVVSANGRRVIVESGVDVEALVRIVRGLETLG
jgi:transposase